MTDREKAIIMAHTGITMLTGDKFSIFHKYIEDILGRSVWTHELADHDVWEEIKEKSKSDFLELCEHEETREWIPIKTRPLTEEEKQNAIENHDIDPDDLKYPLSWHFDCKLPELKKGEQSVDVLVTTDLGFVKVTNFFIDYLGCLCFEDMDEAGEFVAWMPLPESYQSEVQDADN